MPVKKIYTIGHSNRTESDFLALLRHHHIQLLADIRHFPGSRKYPHFSKDHLSSFLPDNGIGYLHLVDLGGRRRPHKNSINTAWRVQAFQGYADYMFTLPFKKAVLQLQRAAKERVTACMCSEAVWWSCHRALVSDYLKSKGWTVLHIMGTSEPREHPYTAPARISDGRLSYRNHEKAAQ